MYIVYIYIYSLYILGISLWNYGTYNQHEKNKHFQIWSPDWFVSSKKTSWHHAATGWLSGFLVDQKIDLPKKRRGIKKQLPNNCHDSMINCWRKKPRPKNIIPTPSDSLKDLGVKEILNEIILFLICLPKRKEVHKQNHGPVKEKVWHSTSFYSGFPWFIYIKMLVSRGVGQLSELKLQGVFFVIRCCKHRCTWATDCSNASFSRFRLLTLANPHGFVSIGFPLGVPWMPPPPPQYSLEYWIGQKLREIF